MTTITAFSIKHTLSFVILSAVEIARSALSTESKDPYPLMRTQRDRRSYCVYIMGSLSGTLYIGMTGTLPKRVFEHKFHQLEGFTNQYDVERLLYWESYDDVRNAIDREKQLKGWRRSKKIALIELQNPQWLDLAKDWYPQMKECAESRGASTPGDRPSTAPPPLSMTVRKSWGEK